MTHRFDPDCGVLYKYQLNRNVDSVDSLTRFSLAGSGFLHLKDWLPLKAGHLITRLCARIPQSTKEDNLMSDREKTYYRRVNAYLNPDKAIQATMIRLKLHGHRRTLMKSYFSIPKLSVHQWRWSYLFWRFFVAKKYTFVVSLYAFVQLRDHNAQN